MTQHPSARAGTRPPAREATSTGERGPEPADRHGDAAPGPAGEPRGTGRPWPLLARAALLLLPVAALVLIWRATPLAAWLTPEAVRDQLAAVGAWAPAIAVLAYVLLGFLGFPLNILVMGTAAAFGAWPGIAYAAVGALLSAAVTYAIGRRLGAAPLRRLLGARLERIGRAVERHGVVAIAAVRAVPVAPFVAVNLVAGALRVPFRDYMAGTAVGLAPGIALLSLVGDNLSRLLSQPTPGQGFVLLGVLIAWAALTWGLQRALRRGRAAAPSG